MGFMGEFMVVYWDLLGIYWDLLGIDWWFIEINWWFIETSWDLLKLDLLEIYGDSLKSMGIYWDNEWDDYLWISWWIYLWISYLCI